MLLLIASMLLADPAPAAFPERTPGMIEACLADALEAGEVSETDDSHRYICSGDVALRLWTFLEEAKRESFEQDIPDDGRWLGREFPLGACFKRIRMADGSPAQSGLSCTIWIPRPTN